MSTNIPRMLNRPRRARPTIRCLLDDLNIDLPDVDVDLGDLVDPMLEELRRIAPTSPRGQKRVLSIDQPLVYRIRVSDERGATWVDAERDIVWLCAARRRQSGSDDDAFEWFTELDRKGELLPNNDDRIRDRLEAGHRLLVGLSRDLLRLLKTARANPGDDVHDELGDWLPARLHVRKAEEIEEVWCGLGLQANDGSWIRPELRDALFAGLRDALGGAELEVRADWPSGEVPWAEAICLYLRDAR